MKTKKFKTEAEFNQRVNEIEWHSNVYADQIQEYFDDSIRNVKKITPALHDAEFLIKLAVEKLKQHNGECKRIAAQMKQKSYKRNNIEGYQY